MTEVENSDYKPQILVAEDDAFQRLLLLDFLEDYNFRGTLEHSLVFHKFISHCCRKWKDCPR